MCSVMRLWSLLTLRNSAVGSLIHGTMPYPRAPVVPSIACAVYIDSSVCFLRQPVVVCCGAQESRRWVL